MYRVFGFAPSLSQLVAAAQQPDGNCRHRCQRAERDHDGRRERVEEVFDREGGEATIERLRAWGYARPFPALAMVVFLLAFAGFPPTVGFVGKLVISGQAVTSGYAYLAAVGVIGSVIALAYYLRIILALYDRSRKSDVGLPASPGLGGATLVILVCLAVVLLGGILPGVLLDWSGQASAFFAVIK